MSENQGNILVLNSGSSSIKYALFDAAQGEPRRIASGAVSGIREWQDASIIDQLLKQLADQRFVAVGHRIVHGGPDHSQPARIDAAMVDDLRRVTQFAPEHLPQAIALIEAVAKRFPNVPQVACFDTCFHEELPTVARTLPLPRRLQAMGVRRYGFHGLSYEYLMRELGRIGRPGEDGGRVILAHLGNGASMAAVHRRKPIDTTMGMTPAGGLVMATRSGDLDPGLVSFLERHENLSPEDFHRLVNHDSGMIGISETSSDMRELMRRASNDARAAEAIDLFCYSAKKWIGALAAALGGVDTLVFSGGIGEHAAEVRSRICEGLGFLGIALDSARNSANAPIISRDGASTIVRVIPTDEESTIVRSVQRILNLSSSETSP